MGDTTSPRIGILVLAYNASTTVVPTLERIPAAFRPRIAEIIVLDDASSDDTADQARAWAEREDSPPTLVVRHETNQGYGGNQKAAYTLAIERGLDLVVLLHGDGQYAPESLPDMVEPLVRGECDAVMGSRMMIPGNARRGGMPLYKLIGNKVLAGIQNRLLGMHLTEFHSGYRAYSTAALRELPFHRNSDDFDFDTQIIIQLKHARKRLVEIPIPTFYGDEICYVNGLRYARDILLDVVTYRLVLGGRRSVDWVTPRQDVVTLPPAEARSGQVGPVSSVRSGSVRSGSVRSGSVRSGSVRSGSVRSGSARSGSGCSDRRAADTDSSSAARLSR